MWVCGCVYVLQSAEGSVCVVCVCVAKHSKIRAVPRCIALPYFLPPSVNPFFLPPSLHPSIHPWKERGGSDGVQLAADAFGFVADLFRYFVSEYGQGAKAFVCGSEVIFASAWPPLPLPSPSFFT